MSRTAPAPVGRARRRRRIGWLLAVLLVLGLVAVTVLVVIGSASRRLADDPRSPTPTGSGALGRLLVDSGVEIVAVDRVGEALAQVTTASTLVVANGGEVSEAAAAQLIRAGADRTVLLRPGSPALAAFGVRALGVAPVAGVLDPGCPTEAATLAGNITVEDMRAAYAATDPAAAACYPAGSGFAYLRAPTSLGTKVDLVAGGWANRDLAQPGNAAFALNLLGSQPRVVWLVAQAEPAAGSDAAAESTLLPSWWEMAVVQAFVALVVVGVWRGRRLGPILTEPLPVAVRASETVEGHGRLYARLRARDQAAEALRAGARLRLGRSIGAAGQAGRTAATQTDDGVALIAAVATRTGLDPVQVRSLIFGPTPASDDDLVRLAEGLDRLEQEARRL